MIGRSPYRRLEELEARLRPAEYHVVQIKYLSPDESVEDGPRITFGGLGEHADRRARRITGLTK
jgi:hypothetical protein